MADFPLPAKLRGRPPPRRTGLSLEYKLPLLMSGLVVTTLAAAILLGFHESRRAAIESTTTRLDLLAREMAEIIAQAASLRTTLMEEVAADIAIQEYLIDPTVAGREQAITALDRLQSPLGPSVPVFLLDQTKRPLLESHHPALLAPLDLSLAKLTGEGFGSLFLHGDRVHFWVSATVERDGQTIGHLAELRTIAVETRSAPSLPTLLGPDVELWFANATAEGPWVSLDGTARDPPGAGPFRGPQRFEEADGKVLFTDAESVIGTPLVVIVGALEAAVLARPNKFLRHALATGLALCLLSAAAAWLLSRQITRPIKALRLASEAIARGGFANGLTRTAEPGGLTNGSGLGLLGRPRRELDIAGLQIWKGDPGLPVDYGALDEVGELAASFNLMAEQVHLWSSHLVGQIHEVRLLATQLQTANERLNDLVSAVPVILFDMSGTELARSDAFRSLMAESGDEIELEAAVSHLAEAVAGLSSSTLESDGGPAFKIEASLQAGGRSYMVRAVVLKGEEDTEEGRAICVTIERGRSRLPDAAALRTRYGLTEREAEIALLLAEGASNKKIAERLGIRPSTVRTHTEHLFPKLGVNSRKAIGLALQEDERA